MDDKFSKKKNRCKKYLQNESKASCAINFLLKNGCQKFICDEIRINKDRTSIVGPSSNGKTYLITEKLKNNTDGDKIIKTTSAERYNDDFKAAEGTRELNKYQGGIVVLDDHLEYN